MAGCKDGDNLIIASEGMEKKLFPSYSDLVEENINPESVLVSDSVLILCALSIPENMCPSPHKEFLKQYTETSNGLKNSEVDKIYQLTAENNLRLNLAPKDNKGRQRIKLQFFPEIKKEDVSETVINVSSVEQHDKNIDANVPCCSKSISHLSTSLTSNESSVFTSPSPTKDTPVKRKQSKFKHWFEDDKPVVSKIGNNQLVINGKIITVNYSDYTKEADVAINYEVDEISLPPLPGYERLCKKEFCRLGCLCQSIAGNEIVRSRCQNAKCMFGCLCFPSTNIDNDGDIRSRLRPRVSLLSWKYADNIEKYTLASNKHVEKGSRGKRAVQPPSELKNGNVLEGMQIPGKRKGRNVQCFNSLTKKRDSKRRQRSSNQTTKISKKIKKPYSIVMIKQSVSDEIPSLVDECGNHTGYQMSSTEEGSDCQLSYEEECPTILYQKIGSIPDIKNDEFLETSTNAITSYGLIRRILKNTSPKDQVIRNDGSVIFLSWTTTESSPKLVNQNMAGKNLVLPILPKDSQWLIYDFPKNYEKISYISFTDIGLVIETKAFIFQKIKSDINNKVVKLQLQDQENRNAISTLNLYILPRIGNMAVLGPVKQNICRTTNFNIPQTSSYIRNIHRQNVFGSNRFWDFSLNMNQELLEESFHLRIQREKLQDSEVLTNQMVPPETMEQIIPELMETYAEDEVPACFRTSPIKKRNLMQLKWSDSMKCSGNFQPHVGRFWNAIPLKRLNYVSLDDVMGSSPNNSKEKDSSHNCNNVLSDNECFNDAEST